MIVTALALLLAAAPAAAPAPGSDPSCDQVTVVVDTGVLASGPVTSACVPPGDALSVLRAAGHAVEGTAAWGTAFVCRVDGRPARDEDVPLPGGRMFRETCARTPDARAYWSLWTSTAGAGWAYATHGVGDLHLAAGDALGLRFGAGDVPPRRAPATAGGAAATAGGAADPSGGPPAGSSLGDHGDGWPAAAVAAGLLLTTAALVPLTRRRTRAAPTREVHPVAWWTWAAGAATLASAVPAPARLVVAAAAVLVAVACRAPEGRRLRPYLVLAALVVALRVVLRVVLPLPLDGPVVLHLPTWHLGSLVLLGPVSATAIGTTLVGALPLAVLVLLTGAAAALADPVDLLRHAPRPLAPVATVLGVAVSTVDRLADVARDARDARRLRAQGSLALAVVPVVARAIAASAHLADALELRGYGARGDRPPTTSRRVLHAVLLLGVVVALGAALVVALRPGPLGPLAPPLPLLLLVVLTVGALVAAARVLPTAPTTRLRTAPWALASWSVVVAGWAPVLVALGGASASSTVVAALPAAAAWIAAPRPRLARVGRGGGRP
ncbi:hypothetical protein [Cellulomonas telluris]|uniref:hypothetical protein n=1 Tax=Cellulomonas telluris TaxID=2306636 RepID=UPI0010A9023C|nr:hypothetical protein [Cellulomonas telluris]